jgi:hypothetical protein
MTPLPAVADIAPAGSSSGGHAVAHEPVHLIVPEVSVWRAYSVNPLESTRTVPTPGSDAVEIVADADPAFEPLPGVALDAVLFAHAERSISATMKKVPTDQTLRLNIVTIISLEVARRPRTNEPDRSYAGNTFGRAPRFGPAADRSLQVDRLPGMLACG